VTIEVGGRLPATQYAPPLVSWDDYLRWALANEFSSEWVDGRIIDRLPQNLRSNLIVQFLLDTIRRYVEPKGLERLLFNFLMRLPDRPIARVPDLMYISSDRMDHLTDTYLDGPADLVIEVASVDSLVRDRRDKFLEYQAGGVREYWLIDEYHEEARFYVLDPAGQYEQASLLDDGIYASTVLPDLRLTVGKLWYEPFASFRNGLTGRSVDPTLPARREPVAIQVNDRRARERYAPPLISWEEFHDWALTIEGRAEWVDGEIIDVVGDNVRHYFLVHFLASLLARHVGLNRLGLIFIETMLLKLSSRPSGRMPDLFFLSRDHRDQVKATFVEGPADIVIEVVSPDSEIRDRDLKFVEYEAARVPEYWLVDLLRHEAHFYVMGDSGKYAESAPNADGVFTSTVLPGLCLKVDWLWRDPLPTLDEALAELG
jgi:Uma2 family endonuclease